MDDRELYCQRCEHSNVVRFEHKIGLEGGGEGLWISQTCQDCRLRVIVRDDACPSRVGSTSEARRGYTQHDGSVLWI